MRRLVQLAVGVAILHFGGWFCLVVAFGTFVAGMFTGSYIAEQNRWVVDGQIERKPENG
jgi:hypothetical protein